MRNIFTITILVLNLRGAPYGLTYDIYENYYDYEISDNSVGPENNNIVITPQFITQPLNVIVNSGETARLPCLVDRPEGFVLLWHKNDEIISVGQSLFDKANTKYRVEAGPGGNYLLVLQAKPGDAGQFRCSVSAYNKREIVHQLRIRVAPTIITEPTGPVITVQEGEDLSLSCSAVSGSPEPVLRWGRCAGEVLAESPQLSLTSLARSEAGCYQCLADNGWGVEPVTRDLTLIVQFPPVIQMERTEDSVEMMRITCSVVSRPAARVVIFREAVSGERTELYRSESDEESDEVSVGHNNDETILSLQLTNLGLAEFGSYTCSAVSPLGRAHQTIEVAGWPRLSSVKISSDPSQSSCYSLAVQLYSQYTIQNINILLRDIKGERLGEFNLPPSYNNFVSHRVCNLTFASNYSLDIRAANSYGVSPPVQYNFTTEDQNIFNLPWSGAVSLQPGSMIMLVLQLLLMIRTF